MLFSKWKPDIILSVFIFSWASDLRLKRQMYLKHHFLSYKISVYKFNLIEQWEVSIFNCEYKQIFKMENKTIDLLLGHTQLWACSILTGSQSVQFYLCSLKVVDNKCGYTTWPRVWLLGVWHIKMAHRDGSVLPSPKVREFAPIFVLSFKIGSLT